MTYVYHLLFSQHNENTIYATLNNHKRGDFKPYLLRSTDGGATWSSLSATLPERGSAYSMMEDFIDPNLLFVATEFGVHFSNDGGKTWKSLKSGLPTIGIRDMAIQQREHDLVLASFGRGFYVLDDYSPLRHLSKTEGKEGYIFPVKESWMFVEKSPLGLPGKGFMGESYYAAENPPVGATFTYFYKEDLKTRKEKRQEAEEKLAKENKDVYYPSYEALKEEEKEENSYLLFVIRNDQGEIVRKLKAGAKKGVNRIVWDFRYPSSNPINLNPSTDNLFQPKDVGQFVAPGNYTVTLSKYQDGIITDLHGPEKFVIKVLPGTTLPATDRPGLVEWQRKAAELQRSVQASSSLLNEVSTKIKHLREAVFSVAKPNQDFVQDILKLEQAHRMLQQKINGDAVANRLDIDQLPSISSRLFSVIYDGYSTTSDPTTTMKEQLQLAGEEFGIALTELKDLLTVQVTSLEKKLEAAGAPFTPGRIPDWKKN